MSKSKNDIDAFILQEGVRGVMVIVVENGHELVWHKIKPLQAREDVKAMAKRKYSIFPRFPELEHYHHSIIGGARGVVVIVVRNGHGDTSSNPGRDWLHFT